MPGKNYYFWSGGVREKPHWFKPVLIVLFLIFSFRLFQLQMVRGEEYLMLAESNRIQSYRIPSPRGRIFDRNGIRIAGTRPAYSLFISPAGPDDLSAETIAERLSELTGRSEERILLRLRSSEKLPFGVINLIPNLTFDEILILEEHSHYLPRTFIHVDPVREYPFGEVLSHFLGYTGQISQEELVNLRRLGYRPRDRIGKTGVEKVFDLKLRGIDGYQEVEVGVTGHHRKLLNEIPPEPGTDILLTIDSELQKIAHDALGERRGAVIAMNPKTGDILLWLSRPGFDPGAFTMPMTQQQASAIFHDPGHPLFNRPIQGQYPPGSTFKMITAAAALSEGVSPEKEYRCAGSIIVGFDRRVFRCWGDSRHGVIDMKTALAKSCNVYFYNLGLEIGYDPIKQAALSMGLGDRVQNYFDNEARGNIPDPDWKRRNIGGGWNPGDNVNMSVGQGYVLSTPIQMLRMVSMIGAEGIIVEPRILKLEVKDGELIEHHTEVRTRISDIPVENIKIIKEGMKMAVEPGGTAGWFNVPVSAGAKTGTAQNPFGDDHAWFAAYAPSEEPEIAIVVIVENAGYGSVAAMPVAREVFRAYFRRGLL